MKKGRIPVEPFRSIVREFIDKLDMGEIPCGTNDSSSTGARLHRTYSPYEAIAGWAKVKTDTLYQLVVQKRATTVSFDFADAVLTATVGPGVWHSDPELAKQYLEVDLTEPPEERFCWHGATIRRGERNVDVCSKCRHEATLCASRKRAARERQRKAVPA